MRLAGISSINQANEFLKTYLPIYNKRFATHPKSDVSFLERPQKLSRYKWTFVAGEQRIVGNDYTIRYHNRVFLAGKPRITQRKQQVTIKQGPPQNRRFCINLVPTQPPKSSSKILRGINQSLEKDLRFEIKGKKIFVKEITDLIDQHSEQNP